MEMKFVRMNMLDNPDSEPPCKAGEILLNTIHINSIDEHPASDADKESYFRKFQDERVIDKVCDLLLVTGMVMRIPYTKAEFLEMYEDAPVVQNGVIPLKIVAKPRHTRKRKRK